MSDHPRVDARTRRRRIAALAATGTLVAVIVPALALLPGAATAVSACVPANFTASAHADLLKLDLLDLGALGVNLSPVAHVTIGDTTADMAHDQPQHARATATYLGASIAGITVPPALLHTRAEQDAPPPHAAPDEHSAVALDTGVLRLGVGNVMASAGRTGEFSCGAAVSADSVADLAVLPGTHGHSLIAMPRQLNGTTATDLLAQNGQPVSSGQASVGLAEVDLFGGTAAAIGVKVVTEPTLIGVAGGSAALSSVTYTSPVLDVTLPGGQHVTLDSAHPSLDFVTSTNASAVSGLLGATSLPLIGHGSVLPAVASNRLEVRLSIGSLTSHVAAGAISASASTLRLQVMLAKSGARSGTVLGALTKAAPAPSSTGGYGYGGGGGGGGGYGGSGSTVLDTGIGVLSVTATAPVTSTPTPTPSTTPPTPSPSTSGPSGPPSSTGPSGPPSSSTGSSGPPSSKPSKPATSVAGTAAPSPPSSLPLTGGNTVWVVGVATVLLALGRLLMVLARRRAAG